MTRKERYLEVKKEIEGTYSTTNSINIRTLKDREERSRRLINFIRFLIIKGKDIAGIKVSLSFHTKPYQDEKMKLMTVYIFSDYPEVQFAIVPENIWTDNVDNNLNAFNEANDDEKLHSLLEASIRYNTEVNLQIKRLEEEL